MKKIYVTPLCETVLAQMEHNLLGESKWVVDGGKKVWIIGYTGKGDGTDEDGISWNSKDFFGESLWGSLWDDDSDLSE